MLVAMDVLLVLECNREGYDSPGRQLLGLKVTIFRELPMSHVESGWVVSAVNDMSGKGQGPALGEWLKG